MEVVETFFRQESGRPIVEVPSHTRHIHTHTHDTYKHTHTHVLCNMFENNNRQKGTTSKDTHTCLLTRCNIHSLYVCRQLHQLDVVQCIVVYDALIYVMKLTDQTRGSRFRIAEQQTAAWRKLGQTNTRTAHTHTYTERMVKDQKLKKTYTKWRPLTKPSTSAKSPVSRWIPCRSPGERGRRKASETRPCLPLKAN